MFTNEIATNRVRWDITIYSRDGQPILAVEARTNRNSSPQWADQYRRNILAHDVYPTTRYFMFAFPDRLYLWRNSDTNGTATNQSYSVDATPILQPYFKRVGIPADEIDRDDFELLIGLWLDDLISSDLSPDVIAKSQAWLVDSGLYQLIRGGYIEQGIGSERLR